MTQFDLSRALTFIVILLVSIDVHELAHAVAADRLGDPTPRSRGQLSLNPFVHMDQFGLVLLVIMSISGYGFTYGRTHVTPTRLRFGPQRGNALVAIVGPISNLVLAGLVSLPLVALLTRTFTQLSSSELTFLVNFLFDAMKINVLLFIFNLIPIPPLDGFTILGGFLSARQMYALAPLQQWGPLVFLVLILGDPQLHILGNTVFPAVDSIDRVLCSACSGA
ncbi:MAG: site-2 protease family protein [Chloroflexota bacterium]